MLAYILPTRNRPERLEQTLRALGDLPRHEARVLVVDNASRPPVAIGGAAPASGAPAEGAPATLPNGLEVAVLRRPRNEGAAARNAAARAADPACEWLVMLDDDSHPADLGFLGALRDAAPDVAAVAAEIVLPHQGRREAGGLPEVFIGCGVAIRRRAFLDAGGYDPAFDYYAEEYDLAARLILAGWRLALDRRFRVVHHKVEQGRDMGRILRRLVRNNGWVAQRYAPESCRRAELGEVVRRYRAIAQRESAMGGYLLGLASLGLSLRRQKRTPMSEDLFDRFTGLAAARAALRAEYDATPFRTAIVVEEGKNARLVRTALVELGVRIVEDESPSRPADHGLRPHAADALVIGTLSPGPMLDAWDRLRAQHPGRRIIAPWPGLVEAGYSAGARSASMAAAA
jgi:GT2 family glycosyltransferase